VFIEQINDDDDDDDDYIVALLMSHLYDVDN